MSKIYTVTTVSHWGGIKREWYGTELELIQMAINEATSTCLEGYSDHMGDIDHVDYPRFDDEGDQVSGAHEVTIQDALAWWGQYVQSLKFEEA